MYDIWPIYLQLIFSSEEEKHIIQGEIYLIFNAYIKER